MLLSMLDISGIHTAYPVIVRKRKFGHGLWIDTPAGGKIFDAARQHKRSLSRYRSTNLRRSVRDRWSTGRVWEGGWGAWRPRSLKKFSLYDNVSFFAS